MDEEMMRILSEFDQVDDSSFPDFVLNPRLGDFADPSIMRLYMKEYKSDDKRLKIIKTGRNRESNYGRYRYKLAVWEDYIEDLALEYFPGLPLEYTVPLLLQAADAGEVDEEVPNKPRMKNSKKTRLQKKLGFDPLEGVEMNIEELDSNVPESELDDSEEDDGAILQLNYTDEEKDTLNQAAKQVVMKSRLNKFLNATTAFAGRNDISLIAEYRTDTGDIRRQEQSAFDALRKEEELELIPEYILKNNERIRGGRLSMHGLYVQDSQEEEQLDLYRELMNGGFNGAEIDAITNGGANLSKSQLKIISSELGEESFEKMKKFQKMSKKKAKKKKRKEAAEASRYINASGSISSLMAMNRHNLGKFGKGSSLANIAKKIYGDDDD